MPRALLGATAILVAGCGGGRLSVPLETYLPGDRGRMVLSASGRAAAVEWLTLDPDDQGAPRVEVWRRVGDARRIGVSHGRLVDRPGDGDALLVTDGPALEWIVARRRVALAPALPRGVEWTYAGGAVDHAVGAAIVALAPASDAGGTLALAAVDVRAMRVTGVRRVATGGADCSLAPAPGPRLYVTCRAPGPPGAERERWLVTRHDRLAAAWTATLTLRAPARWERPGAVVTGVSGDGRSLVIEHGARRGGILEAQTTAIVDTATGAARRFRRDPSQALGRVDLIVPVPGRPAVAETHAYAPGSREHEIVPTSAAFLGISLLDTRSGQIRNVLDTSDEGARHLRRASSSSLGVLPDGTFVLGHDPRRRPP